jgi:hypothetical protein
MIGWNKVAVVAFLLAVAGIGGAAMDDTPKKVGLARRAPADAGMEIKVDLDGSEVVVSDRGPVSGVFAELPGGHLVSLVTRERGLEGWLPYVAVYDKGVGPGEKPDIAVAATKDGLVVQVPDGKGGAHTVPLAEAIKRLSPNAPDPVVVGSPKK